VKLATFNVNGIRSRLGNLLEWLAREAPDVACLQELKAADDAFPIAAIREAGYDAIWHGQKSWNGVAILARGGQPIESRRGLPGDPDDSHSRYLEAAVGGIIVGCLYLPNGNPQPGPKFAYKLAWFERLIQHAAGLQARGHPVVLAGDFNVVPTDADIYNPRSWLKDALLQPESRECYRRLLAQGWTDALRARHPDERIYTFWDYFRQHWQTNSGLRIDHLLLNAELAPALVDAGVDTWVRGEAGASDHAPTWVELDLKRVVKAKAKANSRTESKPKSQPEPKSKPPKKAAAEKPKAPSKPAAAKPKALAVSAPAKKRARH
jgi:exodeoxyribonuclease-3